jgi:arsenate reductase (thioredoxin)
VLFLCTHNSARSQMAEGLLRHLAGNRFEVYSAGTEATFVRPQAITVMNEIGIDISGQKSQTLEEYLGQPFDYVITVCKAANEACPIFPDAKRRLHCTLRTPPQPLAAKRSALGYFGRSETTSESTSKATSYQKTADGLLFTQLPRRLLFSELQEPNSLRHQGRARYSS